MFNTVIRNTKDALREAFDESSGNDEIKNVFTEHGADEDFVGDLYHYYFCVARGLCVYSGPHQVTDSMTAKVLGLTAGECYAFPPGAPGRFRPKKSKKATHQTERFLRGADKEEILSKLAEKYSKYAHLDHDFVGYLQNQHFVDTDGGDPTRFSMLAAWAPHMEKNEMNKFKDDRDYHRCRACMLEFLVAYFKKVADNFKDTNATKAKSACIATAALAKISQLRSLYESRLSGNSSDDRFETGPFEAPANSDLKFPVNAGLRKWQRGQDEKAEVLDKTQFDRLYVPQQGQTPPKNANTEAPLNSKASTVLMIAPAWMLEKFAPVWSKVLWRPRSYMRHGSSWTMPKGLRRTQSRGSARHLNSCRPAKTPRGSGGQTCGQTRCARSRFPVIASTASWCC